MKYTGKLKTVLAALILVVFSGLKLSAQETQPHDTTIMIALDTLRIVYIYADTGKALNRVDKYGHKQGLWEQKYTNGHIRYKGHFKDDKPTGVFKYFYEDNDSLRILSVYSDNGRIARVHEYYFTGAMAATGKYIDQQKDSIWKLYDDMQNMREKDQYENGKKEGKTLMFYADGNILESKTWHNDLENGQWLQYYDNGVVKEDATFVNGKLEGPAQFYSEEGKLLMKGTYKNDVKDGMWTYYDDDGNKKDSMKFNNGKPADMSKFMMTPAQLDSLKQLNQEQEQNKPKNIGEDEDYGN